MRKATPDDIPQLLVWGREFHAASPYRERPYSAERVSNVLRHMMEHGVVLISEKGMAGALKAPMWFTEGEVAQELFWWGDASLRQGLEDWAEEQGCVAFTMVCLENDKAPALSRLYRMNGFQMTEHHFMKGL